MVDPHQQELARLAVASIPEGTTTRLGVLGIRPLAVLDGYLVYMQADGAVMAVATVAFALVLVIAIIILRRKGKKKSEDEF